VPPVTSILLQGLKEAFTLIMTGDRGLIEITFRAITVSGLATVLASCWSIPFGVFLGLGSFKGRQFLKGVFNAIMGVPAVAIGLLFYLILSRSGPLGSLQLLYTPSAIILGQSVLITPILVSLLAATVETVDPDIKRLALTLGASELKANLTVLGESMGGILLSISASFNRAIAELGVALMLGGNIRGATRVLTTVIALETGRGAIPLGISLTVVLIGIVGVMNALLYIAQRWL
jgi:tungstate transport system permease protein|tara:strand:- start:2612 stop:3313 length:702 start_codon:yes stop_codon:yes gene_type:complete